MGRSRYKAGFASGFGASFFSPGTALGNDTLGETGGLVARTSIAATVGGTASVIGGGKFANGATSGAFVHLFNAEGGFRRLDNPLTPKVFGTRGSPDDRLNLMIAHEGFILQDGTAIGFFADGMVRVDAGFSASDYSQLVHYDDNILLQAIGITPIGQYDLTCNNCQHWVDRVDANYHRLGGK